MGYADRYDPDTDFDHWYTDATGRAIVEWIKPGDAVLELGCATGRMSEAMVKAGATVVGVDRASVYLRRAVARDLTGARFLEADVVALDLGEQFDHVVMANIVHEVPDAGALFATATRHLAPNGLLHVSLQNPQSIHRLVGQEMGVISQLDEVSDRGRQYETVELYDADDLAAFGAAVGLTVAHRTGVMLKPLPNDLMADLPEPILEGFVSAARHLPDHSAMNYLVLRRGVAGGPGDG